MIGEEIGYIDMAEHQRVEDVLEEDEERAWRGKVVDVVLSDMSEPWPQTSGFWKNYLTKAYFRMHNVTGIRVKDHGDSMVFILLPENIFLCFPVVCWEVKVGG
jgi:23S rRNA U2552 (ribose-2'-O)-methylase RlmE/FtsJ